MNITSNFIRNLFVLLLLSAITPPALSADFSDNSCKSVDGSTCVISMRGIIKSGDYERYRQSLYSIYVRQALKQIPDKSSTVFLSLDSLGGDLSEAIKIAESLINDNVVTNVEPNASCVSSCVIILAGGVARIVDGNVGIHRPFLNDSSSPQDANLTFDQTKSRAKALFEKSGVTPSLWDAMMAIPPSNVRYLTPEEVVSYGLKGNNPAHFDYLDSVRAKKLGVNKVELYRRDRLVKKYCTDVDQFSACYDQIMKSGAK